MATDLVFIVWTQAGPPAGKGGAFFYELALLIGGSALITTLLTLYPDVSRVAIPCLLMILAWHTGLQLSLSDQWPVVVSAFDVFIPLLLGFAYLHGWYRTDQLAPLTALFMKRFALFGLFVLWGFCLAVIRGVDVSAMLMNLKAFALYPFLALIVMWCITSWRVFYWVLAIQLGLIAERAAQGIVQRGSLDTSTLLASGQIVTRANGDFASVNQFALYVVSGAVVMTALVVAARSRRLQVILSPALVVASIAILLTLSRGAWLSVIVGLAAMMILLGARRAPALIGVAVTVALVVQIAQPHASQLVTGRLTSRYGQSIQERQDYYSLGGAVLEHYPFGAGWGAAFADDRLGLHPDHNPTTDWPWYHNDYLQLATEVGVLGLAAFLWIWVSIVRLGVSAVRSVPRGTRYAAMIGLLASVCAMLVEANTDQFFWRSDIAPHIWIMAGLLLATVHLTRSSPPEQDGASVT